MTEENEKKPDADKDSGLDIAKLMESVKQELVDEDKASKEAQAKKIAELESKSYSKDEVKDMMKAVLKQQAENNATSTKTKEELETEMASLKEKLDEMSGSQINTQVEDKPFKSQKESVSEDDKVELTDEWVLKQKGLI